MRRWGEEGGEKQSEWKEVEPRPRAGDNVQRKMVVEGWEVLRNETPQLVSVATKKTRFSWTVTYRTTAEKRRPPTCLLGSTSGLDYAGVRGDGEASHLAYLLALECRRCR